MSKEVVVIESAVPYNAAVVAGALEVFSLKQNTYNTILNDENSGILIEFETSSTTKLILPTETETDIPELIIDPPPIFEDGEVPEPTLAP
jgi:hypothetical protein